MNEEDIRPSGLMRENARLLAEDVEQVVARCQEFIRVDCPACQSHRAKFAFDKWDFSFVVCCECQTMYINPRPSPELLYAYYATAKNIRNWNDCIFPATEEARSSQIFVPRANRLVGLCQKYGVGRGCLVDVGAGFGTFCEMIKGIGGFKRVVAVEPARALAATCRRRGIEVVEKPIEEVSEGELGEVSVITCFELIEHLFSPMAVVQAAYNQLAPGGLLVATVPNIKGFDLCVLGGLSENVFGPNHLNYFNPKSLALLCRACGFEVLETLTPGRLDVELVHKKVIEGKLDLTSQPFLKNLLVDDYSEVRARAFQQFLADNQLSSHLWIVARRARESRKSLQELSWSSSVLGEIAPGSAMAERLLRDAAGVVSSRGVRNPWVNGCSSVRAWRR